LLRGKKVSHDKGEGDLIPALLALLFDRINALGY
jgi:hypothetical protein